ncbi:hypothetical protein EXIGLDRAFT_588254, partial [Exidia glandulosa HHB12029]
VENARGGRKLRLFKCDGSKAYRRAPAHPLWQIKQVVSVNGERHVDRCCNFGTKSAGDIFFSIMALILWSAQFEYGIEALLGYVDDVFSFDDFAKLVLYRPYNRLMCPKQSALLHLWDYVGLPHSDDKQVNGAPLVILGLEVDPNAMTVTMPDESRLDLISKLDDFVSKRTASDDRRRRLQEWQRLLGHCNWALNAYPLLRPALTSTYEKIRGKTGSKLPVILNSSVVRDLSWFSHMLRSTAGVQVLSATDWSPLDADLVLWCDASLSGLGFWCPAQNVGFTAKREDPSIIFNESLCTLAALNWACSTVPSARRIAVYTDSHVTVDMFDSLKALPAYNGILLAACERMLSSGVSARFWHVPGEMNSVADALSRDKLDLALQLSPGLVISQFDPPSSYTAFCERHNLPLEPSPDTLSLYITYESHYIDPKSVKTYLSGICNALESAYPDVRSARTSPLVRNTLAGRQKMCVRDVSRKAPLSAADVTSMIVKYAGGSFDDLLFVTILATGFNSLNRLGELVWPDSHSLQDVRKCISITSLVFGEEDDAGVEFFSYWLPGHKGNRFFEG